MFIAIVSALLGLAASGAAASDGSVPTITQIQNNYSWVLPGAANYGIAPGSIFVILGAGLAAPGSQAELQDSSKGLPTQLNGAGVTIVVSGVTVHPALYYATPTAIAAVLPSTTPLGTGTVAVTCNGLTSDQAPIQVVQTAPGLATMSGDGAGAVMATDANYHFISPTASVAAGQIVTLWGTGLGADTQSSDTTYGAPHQITNIPLTVFVGGVQATVVWAGRSGYPGLDQINVQMPQEGVTPFVSLGVGCAMDLTAVGGGSNSGGVSTPTIQSNTVLLPSTMNGGPCMRPSFVVDPVDVQQFAGKTTVRIGSLTVLLAAGGLLAGGYHEAVPGAALTAYGGSGTGSCVVVPPDGSYQTTPLYSNAITITGPAAMQTLWSNGSADFGAFLPASWLPAAGATFTFAQSGGYGTDIGAFNTSVSFPAALEWTNQSSIGTISRSKGIELTWTGGDANGVVAIRGTSFAPSGSKTPSTSFMCSVPASLGQFTVPSSVLQALPAGPGTLTVENQSAPQSVSATGLDMDYAYAGATLTINAAYN